MMIQNVDGYKLIDWLIDIGLGVVYYGGTEYKDWSK